MSLYNDERPQTFSQVVGQRMVLKQMKRKIAEGRFPQTALLTGPRGTGKTTCARIVAKALNCEHPSPEGEPCCECESCRSITAETSPTVVELDSATHNGVEDVRALIEKASFIPTGKKKVFILDEVHMFSTQAWNALLKTLEEPPENTVFLMATSELQNVPATVLSRCLKFDFKKVDLLDMSEYLFDVCRRLGIGIEPDALNVVLRQSDGCVRDALSILEQFIGYDVLEEETVLDMLGLTSREKIHGILNGILDGVPDAALAIVDEADKRGNSLLLLVKGVLEVLTEVIAAKAGAADKCDYAVQRLSEKASDARIDMVLQSFLEIYPLLQKREGMAFLVKATIRKIISSESLISRMEKDIIELKAYRERAAAPVVQRAAGQGAMQEAYGAPGPSRNGPVPAGAGSQAAPDNVVQFPGTSKTQRATDAFDFEYHPDFDDLGGAAPSAQEEMALFDDGPMRPVREHTEPPGAGPGPGRAEGMEKAGDGVMHESAVMSFDEIMAKMQSRPDAPDKPVGEAEDEEPHRKEDGPVQEEEEEEPDFSVFDSFLSGGSARL